MAEATPTDIYQAFCAEDTSLSATIATLEAAPTLANLDALSAAVTRRTLVRAQLATLGADAERYEQGERHAAMVAVHSPRWATAATDKANALTTIYTALGQLKTAVDAYTTAHGAHLACLSALGDYSAPYRANYTPMPARLAQIIDVIVKGDMTWLSRLQAFDAMGCTATLPQE